MEFFDTEMEEHLFKFDDTFIGKKGVKFYDDGKGGHVRRADVANPAFYCLFG